MPAHQATGVTRKVDWLGVFVFTLALVPILIGLTNKQALEWTDFWVGGLIVIGLVLLAVFVWVESRAKEPIMPLGLFRNRTFTISLVGAFLASFGFFGAIIFLPRWYQVVNGSSATESGYQLLPLLAGLIISSIISGQIVSRTGRYKWMTVAALVTLCIGLFLLSNLRADTPTPILYIWQFICGVGIGPTMAVFTIIVQNAVPWQLLGAATSNLTLFRQSRRNSRPGDRRHGIRLNAPGRGAGADRVGAAEGRGSTGADHSADNAVLNRRVQPRRHLSRRRHGRAHPGPGSGAIPAPNRAIHRQHRCRHPRGFLAGNRQHHVAEPRRNHRRLCSPR